MLNVEKDDIRELNPAEIEAVSGAYSVAEFKSDAAGFFQSLQDGIKDGYATAKKMFA